jgi:hypothetical protein
VLQLQRALGNRAVGRLLEGWRGGAEGAVQRKVIPWMPGKYEPPAVTKLTKEGNHQALKELGTLLKNADYVANWLDEHTTRHHAWVQEVTDGALKGTIKLTEVEAKLDNMPHAADFANKLADKVAGVGKMSPAAAGGYVIEDYVSAEVGQDALTQVTPPELQGSRPDVIYQLEPMNLEDGYAALYDLTSGSKESVGHVLKKGGGSWIRHLKYPYVAEIVYPPLKFDGTSARVLSEEELKMVQEREDKKMALEEEAASQEREKWAKLYEVVTGTAVDLLSQDKRGWMKVSGRRGTSILLDAGIAQGATGWAASAFDDWWSIAEGDANPRKALETVAGWLGM